MIWGKIIGGVAGLALGRTPLGMLAGALLGHMVDSWLVRGTVSPELERRNQLFVTAVTSLAAKLAKVDGPVSRAEVDCFKALFRFNPDQKSTVAQLFDQAKLDPRDFERHARSLADNFSGEPFLLAEIFTALRSLAAVDGGPNAAELAFLQTVATIFGMQMQGAAERPRASSARDPYDILQVARTASMDEIKIAWRRLSREHHPDNLIAKGVPDDYVALATQKMAAINAAYDQIRTERGIP